MANILITGVSSGIGRALAEEFAKLGHNVIGCARRSLVQLEVKLEQGSHFLKVVDITDYDQLVAWSAEVHRRYESIDIIINNAGIKNTLHPLWQIERSDFNSVVNTNLIAVADIIRVFVPRMIERNKGIIINLSSEWGRVADACVAPYCATKYAIEGLTQAFAKELPGEMIAIALSPLIVYTELLEQCKHLLLPGEYELGVTPKEWATYVVPKIFGLHKRDNGSSLTWSPKCS